MNIEHLKELMTPVAERLPEEAECKLCIYTDGFNEGISLFRYKNNEWIIGQGEFYDEETECPILYWLDPSTLTTKVKAIELAEKAINEGIGIERRLFSEDHDDYIENFINEHKTLL